MSGIEPGLLNRLENTLRECREFQSDQTLYAVFVDARISIWREELSNATSVTDRVTLTIGNLENKYSENGDNALILLLYVLKDKYSDIRRKELTQLIKELGHIVEPPAVPQTPPPVEVTEPPATPPTQSPGETAEPPEPLPTASPGEIIESSATPPTPPPSEITEPPAELPADSPLKNRVFAAIAAIVIILILVGIVCLYLRPRLTIESHLDGDIVERETTLSGTYRNLRSGWTVWSLVYPEDNRYWVQGYWDVEQPQKGEWTSEARFGTMDTRDIDDAFEFIILAVKKGSDAESVLRTAYNREQNYIDKLPAQKKAIASVTVVRGSPIDDWLADFWPNDDQAAQPVTTTQIASPYLFQEWWGAPFEGMPEEGWTARFARRIHLPQNGEYCFYRVRDGGVDVALDGIALAFSPETAADLQVGSVCRELQAGLHDVQIDLTDTTGDWKWLELWYEGPGVPIPTDPLTETWQATFYPLPDLTGTPVLHTSFAGDDLNFTETAIGDIPVVNFSAALTRTFTLAEAGTYRFELQVDDGARLSICGVEVLDEWHGGPGNYVVDRYLEAGDHTLYLEYYELFGLQYAKIQWKRMPDPELPIQRVLYISNRDSHGDEIFIADADGSNPRQLTHNTYPDRDPAWSPDGQRIIFAAAPDEDGVFNLYVMNADGSDPQLLIERGGQPRWSPDGSRIVFVRWFSENEQNLWLVNADGTEEYPLTEGQVVNYNPDWSPDGSRIAFESFRDGNAEIYVVNTDGSDLQNLSNSPDTWDGTPAWSPDGETIAFASHREDNTDIYAMKADGSDIQRVTNWDMEDACPDWSPDGRFLVFHSGDEWNRQIYKKDPYTDADRIALTNANGRHEKPQWSPPGYGYTVTTFTDGDAVNAGAIAVTQDFVWTGGSGGLLRWERDDPEQQRKYTSEDGLVGNDIRNILALDAETLWISVGYWPFYDEGWGQLTLGETEQWRTFTPGDGLNARQVFALYRDNQGRIWAGTSNGLWMYGDQGWQSWLPSLNGVSEIYQASDGALWLETSGPEVLRYVPTSPGEDTSEAFDLMALLESENDGYRYVSAIVEGLPGELWFGTNAGVVRYDGETWDVPDDQLRVWVYDIVREDDGTLWFGIDGWEEKRLIRRNPDGELHIYTADDGLQSDITALALDGDGILWAAGNGLNRYDRETDSWTSYWAHDDEQHNHVSAIFQDTQGALWFGHSIFHRSGDEEYIWRDGVSRYAPEDSEVWRYFDKGAVHTIQQDNKDVLWFGFDAAGRGACPYDLATGEWDTCLVTTTSRLESNNVDAIFPTRDSALWFGTSDGGLTRIDGEFSETFRQEGSELLSDNVHCLIQDKEGALWITTDRGVNRLFYDDERWGVLDRSNGLIADEVLAVALEGEDSIWFGTREGLSRYNYMTKEFINITGGPRMPTWAMNCQQRLLVDRDGALWVGTDDGLYRRTPEGGWIHLTTANGLASNHILAIYEDADGSIWVGTPYGINRLLITSSEP